MFKSAAAAAAITLIVSGAAMAQPVLTKGQFLGVSQYTGLYDPAQICASLGLSAGQTNSVVATVGGLGKTWSTVIANTGNGTNASPYGVSPITCTYPALPSAKDKAWTKNADGSYSNAPSSAQSVTCTSNKGTFTLTSSNTSGSLPTTNVITVINNGAGNLDSGFSVNTTNTALAAGNTTLCYLSTSALYLNTVK